jgi:hypothetical protein
MRAPVEYKCPWRAICEGMSNNVARGSLGRSIFVRAMLVTLLIQMFSATARAERTITEELIHDEIIRLGGDWEGYEVPAGIGFHGEKFEQRHFEMLEHVRDVQSFTTIGVDIGPEAMKSIGTLAAVKRIEIQKGKLSGEGSEALEQLKALETLVIIECDVPGELVRVIGRLPSLRRLNLEDVDLPADALGALSQLEKLDDLIIASHREFTPAEIDNLKSVLPGCKVDVTYRRAAKD